MCRDDQIIHLCRLRDIALSCSPFRRTFTAARFNALADKLEAEPSLAYAMFAPTEPVT